MAKIDRRRLLAGTAAALLAPRAARAAATVTDGAGRRVPVPARAERVFPAGPPAAILLYTLAPDLMLGWPRPPRGPELEFLPEAAGKPEIGRLTGRGNTANLELVLALAPDLIVDAGMVDDTYVSLAERVQAQTGIPYVLLNGRFDHIPATYRTLGRLVGREQAAEERAAYAEAVMRTVRERTAAVPEDKRPRVYYGRGPRGLETGLGGSINVETLEFLGAHNVAGAQRGGLANVSVEQVLLWDPEIVITVDPDFARHAQSDPRWASVAAVRKGRVHLAPHLPFGWIDFPPAVNRLIGLWWLGKILYPDLFPEDLREKTRDFYARFYHVRLSDAQVARLLAGND